MNGSVPTVPAKPARASRAKERTAGVVRGEQKKIGFPSNMLELIERHRSDGCFADFAEAARDLIRRGMKSAGLFEPTSPPPGGLRMAA